MIGCILINSPHHSIMNQEEAYQFCHHKDSRLLELYTKEQWKLLDEILGTKKLKVGYKFTTSFWEELKVQLLQHTTPSLSQKDKKQKTTLLK